MDNFTTQMVFAILLIGVGYVAGSIAERRHLARLADRERKNGPFLVTQLKSFPACAENELAPQMVVGEVVIASDYFKTFLASLRRIFGGEVRSFHSLLSRARREATQRVVEQSRELGYNAICNLRIETADVGGSTASKKGAAMVAVIASATAYHYQSPSS